MGQVTIYLDEQTETKMNAAVKASGISKSKWIAHVIREKAGTEWPEHVTELAGAWSDFPDLDSIRETTAVDTKREPF